MEEDMDENTADHMESDGDYAELKKKAMCQTSSICIPISM